MLLYHKTIETSRFFEQKEIRTLGLPALGSDFYCLVHEAGLEPARPEWTLEPESSESANSTTRAFLMRSLNRSNILAWSNLIVNHFFADFEEFFPA